MEIRMDTEFKKSYSDKKEMRRDFLRDILIQIGLAGTQKQIDILTYVLEHVERGNLFIGTLDQISEETGYNYNTVHTLFGALKASGYIIKLERGCYEVSTTLLLHSNQADIKIHYELK